MAWWRVTIGSTDPVAGEMTLNGFVEAIAKAYRENVPVATIAITKACVYNRGGAFPFQLLVPPPVSMATGPVLAHYKAVSLPTEPSLDGFNRIDI